MVKSVVLTHTPDNTVSLNIFSQVFLGGVPWDVSEETLVGALAQFGKVRVEWPDKEEAASQPKGYAYIIFESEKHVSSSVLVLSLKA